MNADIYFRLQGAELKIWLFTKIARKDFSIDCTKLKLYVIEWIHSKNENAFWTDMKNCISDHIQLSNKKMMWEFFLFYGLKK